MPRITIEDVAGRAGVSVATVSRVVNGHPDVSPLTRAEVLKVAQDLGYPRIRQATPELNGRVAGLIALGVPDIRGDHVTDIVTGAADALRNRNAHLVICSIGGDRPGPDSLRERLLQGTTAGALLVYPAEDSAVLLSLRSTGYPFVVVEPAKALDESIATVSVTHWAGAKLATEYLIGLGHTYIGVITGPLEDRGNADRLAGYQAALLSRGLPLVPKLVQRADPSIEGGMEAATRLLTLTRAPSAIFALHDSVAVGALRAVAAQGLNVPRDVSVMGFGDTDIASVTTPRLTTIQQPLQGLGRVGADMLWRLMQGQKLDAPRMELSTTLVERESTSPPRGASFLTM
jgi:LacI family transcriptional regulator